MADPITDPDIISPTRDPNSDTNPFFHSIVQGGNTAGVSASGDLQVELGVALPAGTNNIGDVDVLSLPSIPAGTNNIGDVDVLTAPGTAAEAAALPALFVVIAGDDGTDTQPIQLSATGDLKITLDGESVVVTATQLDIDDLDNANDDVQIYGFDGTVNRAILTDAAGHLQVDVLTQPAASGLTGLENHDKAVATASGGSTNHTLTVPASNTIRLLGISLSAAGAGRYELQRGPTASLTTVDVFFLKPGEPSRTITLPADIEEVAAGGTEQFRLVKLNRSGQAQDMYTTFYYEQFTT